MRNVLGRCATFALVLCLTQAMLVLACASSALAQSRPTEVVPAEKVSTAVVVLKGQIDDFNRDELFKRFASARAAGAKTVVLRIDTYGGLVTAGLDISRFIKRQSDLHTIAFVDDKAISAGAMIALACDEIVMEPNSVIGDCAPIVFRTDGTVESMGDAERGKAESPILADFRDSALRNGYDPLLAEAMVSVHRTVHYLQSADGAARRFVNAADYAKLTADGWRPVPGVQDPVDDESTLLTVHSIEAQKIGLSKGEFVSPESLASSRGLNIVATFEPGVGEHIVEFLNSGLVRMILIALLLMSAKVAFSVPGHGVPEALAVLFLGLVVGIPLLTGYAQWWEILIIFAGLALVAFEIFVFPGHFVSGLIGIVMIIGGLVMTFVPMEPSVPGAPGVLPNMAGTRQAIEHGLLVVVGGMTCSLLLWLWLQRYLPKLPYFNPLVLATPGGA